MKTFHCDCSVSRAIDLRRNQEGDLQLVTTVDVRGDPEKGPVPVMIRYRIRFTPDEKYWERDPEFPEETYPFSVSKEFESEEERASFLQTFYKKEEANQPVQTRPTSRPV